MSKSRKPCDLVEFFMWPVPFQVYECTENSLALEVCTCDTAFRTPNTSPSGLRTCRLRIFFLFRRLKISRASTSRGLLEIATRMCWRRQCGTGVIGYEKSFAQSLMRGQKLIKIADVRCFCFSNVIGRGSTVFSHVIWSHSTSICSLATNYACPFS